MKFLVSFLFCSLLIGFCFGKNTLIVPSNKPEFSANLGILVATAPISANIDFLAGNKVKVGVGIAGFVSIGIINGLYQTSYGVSPSVVLLWGGKKRNQGEFRMGVSYNDRASKNNPAATWWPVGSIGFKRQLKTSEPICTILHRLRWHWGRVGDEDIRRIIQLVRCRGSISGNWD